MGNKIALAQMEESLSCTCGPAYFWTVKWSSLLETVSPQLLKQVQRRYWKSDKIPFFQQKIF